MKHPHRLCLAFLGVGALILSACGGDAAGAPGDQQVSSQEPLERPTVVVTTDILGDITENILGDVADITVFMEANADPHSFALSAQQAAELEQADLVIANGLGLEEGLIANIAAARDAGIAVVEVSDHIDVIELAEDESAHDHDHDDHEPDHDHDDHAHDHNHGGADPHFWTDPIRVQQAAQAIADAAIAHLEPIDGQTITAAYEAYELELIDLDAELADKFAVIDADKRNIVTNHNVLRYFAERYDFTVIGAIIPGGTTLASPSPADLADLTAAIKQANVPVIFTDSSQSDQLAQVLADEIGEEVHVISLYTESLSDASGPAGTYLNMMRTNADLIVEAFTS